jgi:hypothetical protein
LFRWVGQAKTQGTGLPHTGMTFLGCYNVPFIDA